MDIEKLERINKILMGHSWPTLRPYFGQSSTSKLPEKPFSFPKQPAPEKTAFERAQDKLERQRTQTSPKGNILTPKPKV